MKILTNLISPEVADENDGCLCQKIYVTKTMSE